MIVNMSEKATEQEIAHVIARIREAGYQPHITCGTERTIVAAVGSGRRHEIEALQVAPGVDNVVAIAQPFKLVSRQVKPERSVVHIDGVAIGGPDVVVIAGPEPMSYVAFIRAVAEASGAAQPRTLTVPAGPLIALAALTRFLPGVPTIEGAEIRRLCEDKTFDIGPMRAVLGFTPISLREGLARTFGSFHRCGPH